MKTVLGKVLCLSAVCMVTLSCILLAGCERVESSRANIVEDTRSIVVYIGDMGVTVDDAQAIRHVCKLVSKSVKSSGPSNGVDAAMLVDFLLTSSEDRRPLVVDAGTIHIQFADGWYLAPWELYDVLLHLYQADGRIADTHVKALFGKYGLKPVCLIAEQSVTLPSALGMNLESPASMYWAIANEYGKAIGLDLESHSGQNVTVYQLLLDEPAPVESPYAPSGAFRAGALAFVVCQDGDILSAWFGSIRVVQALNRKSFEEITGMPIDTWLDEKRAGDDPLLGDPKGVIEAYFASSSVSASAVTLVSSRFVLDWMLSNLDKGVLHHSEFRPFPDEYNAELVSATKYEVEELSYSGHSDSVTYLVSFNLHLPQDSQSAYEDGINTRFFRLFRTMDGKGWRIGVISTGP